MPEKQKPLLESVYTMQGFYLSCDKEEFYSAKELIELVVKGEQDNATLERLLFLVQEMERDLSILKTAIALERLLFREWKHNEKKVIEQNLLKIKEA